MRAAFLVYVSTAQSGEGQADGWYGLTTMNANEPDELDDDNDEDDDDDFVDDDEDSGDDDEDDGDDEEDEEPETWQVRSRALGRAVALPQFSQRAVAKRRQALHYTRHQPWVFLFTL
jgi:hypothetical protein